MSNFEDSVLDFDLNYFLPPSDTPSKTPSDKLRKQLVLVKKKTVAINVLIKTHHAYRDTLEEKEVTLLTAKKECTQACIKYQETLEKCTNLEKEVQTLTKQNAELESRCTLSQNQYEGMKSHANQLQSLIKENESVIEALKVEKQHLEKNNSDNRQKNLSSKHEKLEVILKHLSIAKDIALGKKKLRKHHKKLLENYDYLKNVSSEDDSSSDSGSGQPDFFDDSPHSPLPTLPEDTAGANIEHDVFKLNKTEICIKKDSVKQNEDNNSDSSNEVVSEDTGRGSSLTFSDGEKCFNSPDYFSNNSPISKEASQVCERKILVDSGTSPIRSPDIIHMATSPCIFDDEVLLSDSSTLFRSKTDANNLEYFITDVPLSNEIVTIKEKRKLIDIGTSPIKDLEKVNIATSPLLFEEYVEENVRDAFSTSEAPDCQTNHVNGQCQSDNNVRKTPCILTDDTVIGAKGRHITIDNLANLCEVEISGKSIEERKCLEKNNSIILCDENSNNNDGEIEMILNTMRLTHSLITPIPETPVNIRKNESRNVQEIVQQKSDNLEKDQYKIMQADIDKLKKELADVKRFVNYPLSNYDKSRIEISNESNISVDTEIFDDTSQETIIINANDDNSNVGNEESEITNFNFSNVLRNDVSQVIEYDKLKEAIPSSTSTLHDIPQIDEPHFSNVLRNDVSQVIEYDTLKEAIPSSTSTLHDIPQIDEPPTIDITIEKEYKAVSVNNAVHVTKNDSREAITFEEDLISEDENDITINNGVNHSLQDVSIVCSKRKISRNKNLSKLDKFKQKLLPKSKISTSPTRKLRSKSKLIPVVKLTKMDAIAILNNKSAYENAAKVMAEIKSKEKDLANKQRITRKVIKKVRDKNDNKDLEQQQHRNEESNPKKHIRRKLNDQQCEKHAESNEDSQLDFSPTTARNRTCKLSINYCESPLSIVYCESPTSIHYRESPIQICTSKKETSKSEEQRKRLKRRSTDSPIVSPKRVLRSSNKRNTFVDLGTVNNAVSNNETDSDSPNRRNYKLSSEEQNISDNVENVSDTHKNIKGRKFSKSENEAQNNKVQNVFSSPSKIQNPKLSKSDNEEQLNKIKTVSDSPNKILDHKISNVDNAIEESNKSTEVNDDDQLVSQISHPKQSILCRMLEKHARGDVKSSSKKVPDHITNSICKKLEDGIASINELPPIKVKAAMNKFVNEVQSWDVKHFMLGFIKYLKNPDRKRELFNKVNSPPAPPMTKSEQVLLYVVKQMETRTPNTVHVILTHIEFSLFQLNRTPEFDIIESLSHFYALLCRYFGLKSRLRLFLLDAMYCVQFKAVPIVKQCLDVWMHILPLAHLGIAKSPLVTCLVYLLHFYKCKDGFNRVQEIRNILSRKYFYEMTDLNETKILEMFKSAITDIRDIPIEKKMLRSALIILGKRHGAKWCHKNIIKNILMPMIEREDVSMKIKQFCVQLLGALLKPFPGDMKVHFEIAANHLHEMLQQDPPDAMKEAIFTSLIYINHQNPNRVIRSLLSWMPKQVSPEFEQLLRDYIRGKPLRVWKKILSKITM